ncbi:unnamed protein product [Arctia plantaginis]|uniref:Uncharacterized protein n=1 Tax=Arctia plantaginis TaxID=874455 RepID=A0A8S1B7K1_ARCPL|nr:unnamed protein product [Arctia plantaginis]
MQELSFKVLIDWLKENTNELTEALTNRLGKGVGRAGLARTARRVMPTSSCYVLYNSRHSATGARARPAGPVFRFKLYYTALQG